VQGIGGDAGSQHRHAVSHQHRSPRRAWPRQGRPARRRRQRRRVLGAAAAERPDEVVDAARAVPARVPCASHRWTHRRREGRVEGPRHVVELFDVHAVAPGRRQGIAAEGREVPGAAESAREIAMRTGLNGGARITGRNVFGPVVFLLFISAACTSSPTQGADPVTEVKTVWNAQVEAWNRGDLEAFMDGYWKSPDLVFFTNGAETRGWQQTHDRYRASYQ